MVDYRIVGVLLIAGIIIAMLMGSLNSGNTSAINGGDWTVSDEGLISTKPLEYSLSNNGVPALVC